MAQPLAGTAVCCGACEGQFGANALLNDTTVADNSASSFMCDKTMGKVLFVDARRNLGLRQPRRALLLSPAPLYGRVFSRLKLQSHVQCVVINQRLRPASGRGRAPSIVSYTHTQHETRDCSHLHKSHQSHCGSSRNRVPRAYINHAAVSHRGIFNTNQSSPRGFDRGTLHLSPVSATWMTLFLG